MHKSLHIITFFLILVSCSNPVVTIENEWKGRLHPSQKLTISREKKILLDDETAPKSPYIQIIQDSLGNDILTLLNPYTNSIYFYDYKKGTFCKKIQFEKEGPNGVLSISGYYIKNRDSIFLYNRPMVELVLADFNGFVKNRNSLKGIGNNWALYYPQFAFSTVCPIIEKDNHLILTGLCPFSINDSDINQFKYTACIDLSNNDIEYYHTYPTNIYGNNANWEDQLFMQVYPTISPEGDMVHSFPTSHSIYITKWNANTKTPIYAGSNIAGTITSIDWDFLTQRTPRELIYTHYLQQDLYGGILYDKWREIYYRFIQKGIKNATTRTQLSEKEIAIIYMDKHFKYLGETTLGTSYEWNWTNSFVTKEGLNIEYIDENDVDERYMSFKIFTPENYNQ